MFSTSRALSPQLLIPGNLGKRHHILCHGRYTEARAVLCKYCHKSRICFGVLAWVPGETDFHTATLFPLTYAIY